MTNSYNYLTIIFFVVFVIISIFFVVIQTISINIGNSLLYFPIKSDKLELLPIISNGDNQYDVTDGFINTDDGNQLHYIFIKRTMTSDNVLNTNNPDNTNKNEPIFLYAHGNSGNISLLSNHSSVKYLLKFGSVFLFDYRGYGKSSGEPSEQGLQNDIKTVWNYLVNNYDNDIILYGMSLGCSFVSWLGAYLINNNNNNNNNNDNDMPKGIIMQSGFYDFSTIAKEKLRLSKSYDYLIHYLEYFLPLIPFDFNNYNNVKIIKD